MRRAVLVVLTVLCLGAGAAEAASRTDGSTPAPAKVIRLATHVPARALNQVGEGDGLNGLALTKLRGAGLKSAGKPDLLAMTLAWCPHCAATSWALTIALSRFGTFSGLRLIDSGTLYATKYHAHPSYPHTRGLSFFAARYHSPYVSFTDVILQDVRGHNLDKLTSKQSKAILAFDSQEGAPAVDVAGAYGLFGIPYPPGVLAHKSWLQIADSLSDPSSPIAKGIDGFANLFAAAICQVTKSQPASVCSSSGVLAAAGALG